MKYFYLLLVTFFSCITIQAQQFEDYFTDQALRLDYVFSGNAVTEAVSLSNLSQLPQWAGRKHHLAELLLKGNGQVRIYDIDSKECIYKDSFSTLFQEWQSTDEAKSVQKSFENTFLVPFPKKKVSVEIALRNNSGLYKVAIKHTVDPKDILIKKKGHANITPYIYIHKGDSTLYRSFINVVILAEGYTNEEMPKFRKAAETTVEQILAHQPFGSYANRFNFIAVESVSNNSGVSVPRTNDWRSTAFDSHFDTFYSDRYLTTTSVSKIHDALAGIPYAHIIILANTDVYGGGGILNSYTLTTTGHDAFKPVVVHEFGHSFAGLGDEYFYEDDVMTDTYPLKVEPWEPNITTLVDFASKWKNQLKANTPIPTPITSADKFPIGVYEGAGYSAKGIYRGSVDCRMKTNSCKSFCPVCQKAIEKLIKFYTE